ncbi:HotDog domain-containing protein [Schizothecium vesticola]|uniref:HotDog domain-containing protein n=1 Tax=Schizothecium vesticola TaxID=314040 RepID=A0AA40EQN5_9PEZI|nr:HotDog domain-containing protein [Schizothecium vesticola]
MPNDLSAKKIGALGKGIVSLSGEARLRALLRHMAVRMEQDDDKEWTTPLLPTLTLLSTSPSLPRPSLVFAFTPTAAHLNGLSNMHGGAMATLFDFCTAAVLVLVTRPGRYHYWGVTRTLSTTYLRPVPVGTALLVECEAVAVGRQMSHLRGVLRGAAAGKDGGKGVVYAVCEHGMVNVNGAAVEAMEGQRLVEAGRGKL